MKLLSLRRKNSFAVNSDIQNSLPVCVCVFVRLRMGVIQHAEMSSEEATVYEGKLTNEEGGDQQGAESKLYSGESQWGGSWRSIKSLTAMQI